MVDEPIFDERTGFEASFDNAFSEIFLLVALIIAEPQCAIVTKAPLEKQSHVHSSVKTYSIVNRGQGFKHSCIVL